MRIAFVLDDSLDKTDGVQQYILTLGRWMSSRGHNIHYLVGETERRDIPRVHSLSRNIRAHFNQNRMSTPLPASRIKIQGILDKYDFDILHVQMPYSPLLAGRIIKLAPNRIGLVGTFHILPYSWLEGIATKLLSLVLRRQIKRFDSIYSVSEPARKFAQRSFGAKSQVLPNAVNVAHFQSGKRLRRYHDDKLNIIFLGRLVERKGALHLLKAINVLRQNHELQRVRVLIGGKGPLESKLKQYVSNNHLKHFVHFEGFINEDRKADFLATGDIAVFPSTGGESFGIVLLEAMATSTGVVLAGNNVGYRSVMAGHKDQLIDPANTAEFAKTLKHFISNYRARQAALHWQADYVQHYDVREVGETLLNTYDEIIAKKNY
jgi:phosphatidylinositol alpha-mannosyltransferase